MRLEQNKSSDFSYSYSFSIKDFLLGLFVKKRCPVCGAKLYKTEHKTLNGIRENKSSKIGYGYSDYYAVNQIDVFYKCTDCKKEFTAQELIRK